MSLPSTSSLGNAMASSSSTTDLSTLTQIVDIRSYTLYISLGVASMLTQQAQVYVQAPIPALLMLVVIVAVIQGFHYAIDFWQPVGTLAQRWKLMLLFQIQLVNNIVVIVVGQMAVFLFTELVQQSNSSLELIIHPILWIVLFVLIAMIVVSDTTTSPEDMFQSIDSRYARHWHTTKQQQSDLMRRLEQLETAFAKLQSASSSSVVNQMTYLATVNATTAPTTTTNNLHHA